jgi:hypothetical protein
LTDWVSDISGLHGFSSAWPYPAIRARAFSISAFDSSGGVPI